MKQYQPTKIIQTNKFKPQKGIKDKKYGISLKQYQVSSQTHKRNTQNSLTSSQQNKQPTPQGDQKSALHLKYQTQQEH